MEDLNIKINSYLKGLFDVRDGLLAGMVALTQLHEKYGKRRETDTFDSDEYLDAHYTLEKMNDYVSGEILGIISNKVRNAENNNC